MEHLAHSQKGLFKVIDLELVGGNDMYKAVCRRHLKSMDVKDKNNSFLQTAFEQGYGISNGRIKNPSQVRVNAHHLMCKVHSVYHP